MKEYAVMAEHHGGEVVTLRRGFPTRSEAEEHPVILKLWKRVWVEAVDPKPPLRNELPPLPWDWVVAGVPTANGRFHAYIVDATGRKIAAVWGKGGEKELTATRIVEAVNGFGVGRSGRDGRAC